ncbi:MAG TPA: thiosulfate oxidation carrier protein SoxY [Burkholderiales bacterium]|nr:thiosulfate oxidation carrier protein SoxY [Burkholderiales bacterium]
MTAASNPFFPSSSRRGPGAARGVVSSNDPPLAARRRALALLAGSLGLLLVRPARATPEELAKVLRELFGDNPVTTGKVKLELPKLAENGAVVPVTVVVDSPMSEQDHVKSVHLFAEKNPQPRIVDVYLTPYSGRARVASRIRIADSQHILAVAALSDGSLWSTAVQVEITVAGCGL